MSQAPTTLGKYQIIREIARSNDIVYEAYDPAMNRRVALKELAVPPGSTPQQESERIRRFEREVKAAGSLSHPNIVTIFEVGNDGGRHYMAMEFLDGRTLRNELETKGLVPQGDAIEIALEVLKALEFAHRHGVIHRDVKPENIQLLDDGRVKLTDFGIARLTFEPNLTINGQVFGTPSYMSPEQVVGRDLDARSDLFSVGVVLYEMLSGLKPFPGDSVVSITYAIMNREPAPLAQASFSVAQIVSKALDKSPALRFQNAEEFKRALEDAQRQLASGSPLVQPMAPQMSAPPPFLLPGGGVLPQPAPYGQPYAAPAYPYNPYQGMPPNSPYTPGSPYPPATGQYPVYYPPPPRQPLLSAAQRLFVTRLIIALVVMGTLFGAVVVALNSIGDRLNPVRARDAGLAAQYARNAGQSRAFGDWEAADAGYREAARLEPANPVHAADRGLMWAQAATQTGLGPEVQVRRWERSAEAWLEAAAAEPVPKQVLAYRNAAAEAYVNSARIWAAMGDGGAAIDRYYEARRYAADGSPAMDAIEEGLGALGR